MYASAAPLDSSPTPALADEFEAAFQSPTAGGLARENNLWQHSAMTQQIGFIGLGRMGQRMAGRLTDAGFALTAFDVDPAKGESLSRKGARIAQSPRELAAQSEIVITSVTDGPA